MNSSILQITERISRLPATTKPFSCDIIFIKAKDEQGDFTWIYDVGVGTGAANAINQIQGRKKIVISHFHPDHILNLPFVKYDELFVTKYTKKYTRVGTIITEPIDSDGVKILPMPSSHAKGCLAIICDGYAFLGDGAFCKYKGIHHVYNPQILYEMIQFLEKADCHHFCLDHEQNFIQEREPVINLYKEIYKRRNIKTTNGQPDCDSNKNSSEDNWINVDDYFQN